MPQEVKDNFSTLLEGNYNGIVLKLPKDVGRTNLFQMDIPTTGLPIAYIPYPIPLKYQKFVIEELRLFSTYHIILF